MADAVKGLMDKITNDDPETRGQQLWVMFALAMFLVATLNWYAYVREPEVIEVRQLLEYKNEVVNCPSGPRVAAWRPLMGSGSESFLVFDSCS